jgi:hypothetical protein
MDKLDPEMLKNLDLLLDMDVIEEEADWETVEELDEVAEAPEEETSHE